MSKTLFTQSKHKEYLLLVWVSIFTLVAYPFLINSAYWSLGYHALITILLLTWVYSSGKKGDWVKAGLFFGWLSLILNWMIFFGEDRFILLYLVTTLIFFIIITINVISTLLYQKKIGSEVIVWSIAAYLMMGIAGSFLFSIIETLQPDSFNTAVPMIDNIPSMLYYTFVTMLTLWYGDMVPVGWHAQMRSILVAVCGQLYLVILIGLLIGKYVRGK